jgi:phage minor structural protein
MAFLLNAMEVLVKESLNGEFYVQFAYPLQDDDRERYDMLVEGNDVQFPPTVERGQKFRIRSVQEIRQGRKIYKVVEAHHIAFSLGNYFLDDFIDFAAAKPLEEMLALLGAGTPYTFAIEGNFAPQDIFDWGERTKIDLLQQLRELYGAELSFDNYEITLTTRKGGNHGAQATYRHNMKGIKRKSHDMERITRLYGYGKNGLTIEGHPGYTVKYIDSPYFDPAKPFMAKMEWPDIETKARLLQEMQKHLAKYEKPTVSYDVDFVQLEKVDKEYLDERIREAGDTVTCYDEVLGYSFDARASEFERYPFENKSGRATLSTFREKRMVDYVYQASVGSKKAITYTSRNAVLKGIKYDDSITLVDGMGMRVSDDHDREMVRLGQVAPGQYGMEMYNKAGARTIWQDADTGDARFSGKIIAAIIEGTIINGGTINGGNINGTTMTASLIQGGSIYGSHIATSAAYPKSEISSIGNMFGAYESADSFMVVTPINSLSSTPALWGKRGAAQFYFGHGVASMGGMGIYANSDFEIWALGGFHANDLHLPAWSSLYAGNERLSSVLATINMRLSALESAM